MRNSFSVASEGRGTEGLLSVLAGALLFTGATGGGAAFRFWVRALEALGCRAASGLAAGVGCSAPPSAACTCSSTAWRISSLRSETKASTRSRISSFAVVMCERVCDRLDRSSTRFTEKHRSPRGKRCQRAGAQRKTLAHRMDGARVRCGAADRDYLRPAL